MPPSILVTFPVRNVNTVDAPVVGNTQIVGANLIVGRELLDDDAGIGEVEGAIRSEAEVVREQERFGAASGGDYLGLAIHGQADEGRGFRFGDPDDAVGIHRKAVGAAGLRDHAAGLAVGADLSDASALGATFDDEPGAVGKSDGAFGSV